MGTSQQFLELFFLTFWNFPEVFKLYGTLKIYLVHTKSTRLSTSYRNLLTVLWTFQRHRKLLGSAKYFQEIFRTYKKNSRNFLTVFEVQISSELLGSAWDILESFHFSEPPKSARVSAEMPGALQKFWNVHQELHRFLKALKSIQNFSNFLRIC